MLVMVTLDNCLLPVVLRVIPMKSLFRATYRLVPRDLLEDDVGLIGLHTGCHVVRPLGTLSGWRAGKAQSQTKLRTLWT